MLGQRKKNTQDGEPFDENADAFDSNEVLDEEDEFPF